MRTKEVAGNVWRASQSRCKRVENLEGDLQYILQAMKFGEWAKENQAYGRRDVEKERRGDCVLFSYHAFPCPWIKVAKATLPSERGEKLVGLNGEKDVDPPSQNLVQNRQYRETVTCLPAHTEQRSAKVAEVRIICTRSGSIVILLPPTHQQGSRDNQGHQLNQ